MTNQQTDVEAELIQFETTWGRVKCHDGEHVFFPRFFGEGIASKINRRKTFVTLTFDGYPIEKRDKKVQALVEALKDIETKGSNGFASWHLAGLAKNARKVFERTTL